jgi:LmbE family N-acetylglucosaminyl deacetylase
MARRSGLLTVAALLALTGGCGERVPELRLGASADTRLLVVAPHPDDEAIGAAGLIQRVLSTGSRVHVVVMTSGDAFPQAVETAERIPNPEPEDFQKFGRMREQESERALARLGVPRSDITFLGFPDEGLCPLASSYLAAKEPLVSPYTLRRVPPPDEQVIRDVAYRGTDVRNELERILTTFRPTLVVMPDAEDEHPDHCASYIFMREALDRLARTKAIAPPRVLRYVVHITGWPDEQSGATLLLPPAHLPEPIGHWRMLMLTDEEARTKLDALLTYHTQVAVMSDLLRSFARHDELFLQGDPVHGPECWCDAEHVATLVAPELQRGMPVERRTPEPRRHDVRRRRVAR